MMKVTGAGWGFLQAGAVDESEVTGFAAVDADRERPAEAGSVIGAPRELADDLDLAANDEAYARTLRRVRAASESRPEFVPVGVELGRVRRELDLARKENRKLKHQLRAQLAPVKKGQWPWKVQKRK